MSQEEKMTNEDKKNIKELLIYVLEGDSWPDR